MPNTRSRNKDTRSKIHQPKTVPQQVHFPHRRKTVRRLAHDVPDKRQMTFLPDKMRRQTTVQDSEAEETEDEEPVRPTPKRKRKMAIKEEHNDDRALTPSDTEQIADTKRRRRQSTMTQIVDGRRPAPGGIDPEFMPVKRRRTGRGQKANEEAEERKRRQRTLTQMVPGLGSFGIVSDEDAEEDLEDSDLKRRQSQEYNDAFARGLAEEGLLHWGNNDGASAKDMGQSEAVEEPMARQASTSHAKRIKTEPSAISTHAATQGGHNEDTPPGNEAQCAGATITRKTRRSLRTADQQSVSPIATKCTKSPARKPAKSKFGLLSTPEKRKVFEIASSQSPLGSPISTQVTPRRADRSPLKPRSGNLKNSAETPSKRRKQVTFQEPDKEQVLPPSTMRKFASVIQDSEDEDDAVSDDDSTGETEHDINPGNQSSTGDRDEPISGTEVGAETQAILQSIDLACAHAQEDTACEDGELPTIRDESTVYGNNIESQELGEPCIVKREHSEVESDDDFPQSPSVRIGIKQEPVEAVQSVDPRLPSSPPSHQTPQSKNPDNFGPSPASATLTRQVNDLIPTSPRPGHTQQHETLPSTPMQLGDDSSDEDEELVSSPPQPTPVHNPHSPTKPHSASTNVDDCPIQVPCSPPSHPETQQSYSSKAEQQLHSEYQTYSQYRPNPPASSMHVAADPGFSYQATPFPPRHPTQQIQHSGHISQATTIDPTQFSPHATPRRAKPYSTRSTTTTPQKIPSSMPMVSPIRPPPLLVPSSYPSPGKVMAGWSSPAMDQSSPIAGRVGTDKGESQWVGNASWEDFSIPAPPPQLDISDDEQDL